MKVVIRDMPDDVLVQTITLAHSKASPDNLIMVHCYRCGSSLGQAKGEVRSVTAGIVPTTEVTVVTRCAKCRLNFTFQTKARATQPITLRLAYDPVFSRIQTFHCLICRTQLLQYNHEHIALLPDYRLLEHPGIFHCISPTCSAEYQLLEICDIIEE